MTRFTIAICTKNRHQYLNNLLRDLKKQTITPNEYIFVENIRERQFFSHQKIYNILKHPHIKYLTTTGNNLATSRNICLKNVSNNLIFFLDDDIHIKKDTLSIVLQAFKNNPNVDGFSVRTVHPGQGIFPHFTDYWYNQGYFNTKEPVIRPVSATTILCLKVSSLQKNSINFNETYNFCEDLDFFCQMKKHGLLLCYLPSVTAYHFFGNRYQLFSYLKRFYQYGVGIMNISSKYPTIINYNWLLPSRKIHYLLFPFFFLKNVSQQVISFKKDNESLPIYLLPLAFAVFLFFDIGILQTKK